MSSQFYYDSISDDDFTKWYKEGNSGIDFIGFFEDKVKDYNTKKWEYLIKKILNAPLYKVHSIEIDEFIANGSNSCSYELKGGDLDNLELNETITNGTLSIGGIVDYSGVNLNFNSKNHSANIIKSLTRGFKFAKYQEDAYNFGESPSIIKKKPGGFPNMSVAIVKTYLKVSDSISIVIKDDSSSLTNSFASGGLNNLSPLITFPDSRAYKMEFINKNSSVGYYVCATVNLKPHPLLPNTAYAFDRLDRITYNLQGIYFNYLTEQNPTEQTQNELTVSNVNNPFVSSDANHYTVGAGKILGLAANTQAITTGQFGQYPLLAFCSDGLYALGQGGGEVDYAFVRPLTRDVVTNPDTITPIDDAIVFATVRGLMMTNGQEVLELSRAVEGKPFDFLRVPTMENNNFDYIDIMLEAFSHPSLSGTADEPPKMMGTDVIDGVNFLDYLKAPGTNIGFVYNEHRELIISNPNYAYSYVYSFNSQQFYKISAVYRQFIGDYPRLLGITKHIDGQSDKLIEISNEKASDDKGTVIHFMSRPYTGGVMDYKSAHRSVLRCMIKPVKYLGFYVFGSEDGHIWRLMGGSEFNGAVPDPNGGASVAKEFIDLGADLYRNSCRYFRFACVGVVEAGTKLDYIDFSCAIKSTGKLM
ncbi:hypothetical protein AGMMS49965_13140 [Bacteroidia bacterium]|nr:hypothetical protein AGMMS49965_13140 [Bacteroidia bacterium]